MANNEEQTFPIPEDVEEAPAMASASAQILETHGITTVVHEMKVNGYHLVERKQKTNVDPKASDNPPKMTISVHSRSIDEEDWRNLWNPQTRIFRRVDHISYYI